MEVVLKVRDWMQRDVLRVPPETPVAEIIERLLERGADGVPVVDEHEVLLGYVPQSHLLHRTMAVAGKNVAREACHDTEGFLRSQRELQQRTAREVMRERHEVITVGEGADLMDAIERMMNHGVSRLPVVRRSRLVGMLTRADVLRAMRASAGEGHAEDQAGDLSHPHHQG